MKQYLKSEMIRITKANKRSRLACLLIGVGLGAVFMTLAVVMAFYFDSKLIATISSIALASLIIVGTIIDEKTIEVIADSIQNLLNNEK